MAWSVLEGWMDEYDQGRHAIDGWMNGQVGWKWINMIEANFHGMVGLNCCGENDQLSKLR